MHPLQSCPSERYIHTLVVMVTLVRAMLLLFSNMCWVCATWGWLQFPFSPSHLWAAEPCSVPCSKPNSLTKANVKSKQGRQATKQRCKQEPQAHDMASLVQKCRILYWCTCKSIQFLCSIITLSYLYEYTAKASFSFFLVYCKGILLGCHKCIALAPFSWLALVVELCRMWTPKPQAPNHKEQKPTFILVAWRTTAVLCIFYCEQQMYFILVQKMTRKCILLVQPLLVKQPQMLF